MNIFFFQVEKLALENKNLESTVKHLTERVSHLEKVNEGLTDKLDKCIR